MSNTTQSTTLGDPRSYVASYIEIKSIVINERGELKDGTGRDNMDIFDTMYLDYLAQIRAHNAIEKTKAANLRNNITPVQEKVLRKALNEIINNKKIEYRNKIIQSFKCVTEDQTLVKTYVKALTGAENPDDIAVLSHWMWQVKNKMLDRNPSYHIMPIFYGKQGGGKTVAMTKLIAPINNFRLNISLDQMTDDRYFKSMSENYVIVFDEMQGAERSDINALKKQVTIDYNDYRPMGTNDVFKVKQACSFIGATNRPVAEQIVDSSGMRRFWQVDCQDKLDWDTISSIDYDLMWKGIDENRTDGYILSQIDSISAKQEQMVAKDDLTVFMEELGISAGKGTFKDVPTSELYEEYKAFCAKGGYKPMNVSWFGRKLVGKGIKSSTKHDPITKKTVNYLSVPDSVQLNNNWDDYINVAPLRYRG